MREMRENIEMTRWGDNSQPRWFTLCFTTSAIGSAVQYPCSSDEEVYI